MTTSIRTVVLLVEDDEPTRELFRTALQFAGFSVIVAIDGVDALQKVEQRTPHVVVLDLALPRADGHAVLAELKVHAETQSIPIVVVTGLDKVRAPEGANAMLRKPVDPIDVVREVEKIVSR